MKRGFTQKDSIGITKGIFLCIFGLFIWIVTIIIGVLIKNPPGLILPGMAIGMIVLLISGYYLNADIEAITNEYIQIAQSIGKNIVERIPVSEIQRIEIMYGTGYGDVVIIRKPFDNGQSRKPIRFSLRFWLFRCKNITEKYSNFNWVMQIAYELSLVSDIYMREWGRFWEKPKQVSREKLKELATKPILDFGKR